MTPRWLAIHLPLLGFEMHPASERPTVLVEDGHVAQADALASQSGIEAGMSFAAALSIESRLVHFERDAAAERKRLAWVGLACYRFSSRVGVAPPAGILVEIRGSLKLFGGLDALVEQFAACVRRLGHAAQMAVAPTPLAALLLARAGLRGLPGDAWAELRGVPLACSDLPAGEVERLANMGFRHFGPLLTLLDALPAPGERGGEPLDTALTISGERMGEGWNELGKRFQPQLVDFLARLTGRKADPRPFIEPPAPFRSSVHLLAAVDGKNALLMPMRQLAVRLGRWLVERRFGTARLIWEFKPLHGEAAGFDVRFATPTRDVAAFLSLSQLRLERAELPEDVTSIALRTGPTLPFEPAMPDLLAVGSSSGKQATSRSELVDLLAARLGEEALSILRSVDDPRPEHAWALLPAVGDSRRRSAPVAARTNRPLWLLAAPRPVAIADFELLAGPERIETGWWDDGGVQEPSAGVREGATPRMERASAGEREGLAPRMESKSGAETGDSVRKELRDYFVAVSQSGARCWLYRHQSAQPQQSDAWFLHGYFP